MSNVQDAVKKAREAAAAAAGANETGNDIVEGRVNSAGQVSTFVKPSMASVAAQTSVIPKAIPYLKVNEFGIRVGKSKDFLDSLDVEINMTEDKGFAVKHTIRFGNPAQYLSTYDGVGCDKGGSWGDAMAKAKMADPSAEPYHSVDLVVTTLSPIKLKEETIPAGKQLAINTSKTNFSEFEDFYRACADAGVTGETVKVKITHRAISHNGNDWGVFEFALAD